MDLNYRNVHRLCGAIDTSVSRPVIDLSQVTWFEPYALIYLGMFLRHHNRQDVFFDVIEPNSAPAKSYLTKQNFWNRFRFTPDPETDKAMLRLCSTTSFSDIIDLENKNDQAEDVGNRLREIIQRASISVNADEVTVAVIELVQNFVEHADEGFAAMMAQYYPNYGMLRVAVGDCGIGIKESLLRSGQYPHLASVAHMDAIEEAFQLKVTSKCEGGMGFYVVQEIAKEQHAEMFLSSCDGCMYLDKHGRLYKMSVPYNLSGVHVELSFPERR